MPPPKEELRWIDKGNAPFVGWSLDAAGPFADDEDGNRYLLVAVDPFSKWIEAALSPSLQSWRVAEFLYNSVITRWGKPRYVRTDNGSEFKGSFSRLCVSLGIAHHHITVMNSKANGQAERTIRTFKDVFRRGRTQEEASYWSNHMAPALAMLRFTPSRMTGLSPFAVATGRHPQLPSLPARPLPELPQSPTAEEEEAYYAVFKERVDALAALGGQRMAAAERRVREGARKREQS